MKKYDFTAEDLQTALRLIEASPATGIAQLTIELQNKLRNQQTIDAQDSALRRDIHDHLAKANIIGHKSDDVLLWESATNIVKHIRAIGWEQRAPEVHENA